LEKIDNAKFSWYHVRAIIVAGVGFFTDAYDIFAVNFANVMVGYVYYPTTGVLPTSDDTAIKIATSAGTVIGQLGFGFLADHLGRKKMYGIELMIIIGATLALALAGEGPALNIVGVMIFWRVILGTGVGGDYPLSSIITSEFATVKWRGAMMAAVFANQGWGQFTAALVTFICVVGFKSSLQVSTCDADCQVALDKSWRIIYGFGAVPACGALYFRLTIPETIRYTLDVNRNEKVAAADALKYVSGRYGSAKLGDVGYTPDAQIIVEHTPNGPPVASWHDFFHHFGQWKNGKVLLGTASSWFLLDVAFYGLGLNTSIILGAIGYAGGGNIYQKLYNTGVGNLILSVAGLIPGYWVSVATIDTLGRKPIQIGGFAILTILFCIIGFGFHKISTGGLFALYCLANFFQNFGPNTTTFVVPGEVFPTRYRSTAHGMSAASGKVGAIISQALIGPLRNRGGTNAWLNHVMEIFALFMFVGIFTSMLIPETKRKTLEQLTGEDQYLIDDDAHVPANGSNGSAAGSVEKAV
jgi:PHS family inorganic phosphate transporter-like MFS transporter